MTEKQELAGYALRYLPAVYKLGYDVERRGNPNLTLPEYASGLNDPGEINAIRVYEDSVNNALVFLGRVGDELKIPEGHRESARESFDEETLRQVFDNNKQVFNMRGVSEFNCKAIQELVYAVPITSVLAGYWFILDQIKLFEIGDINFFGESETDQGTLALTSL